MITKADNITKNKYYIFVKANLFFANIMKDEPQYSGKEGVVEYIDDIGQIHVVGEDVLSSLKLMSLQLLVIDEEDVVIKPLFFFTEYELLSYNT